MVSAFLLAAAMQQAAALSGSYDCVVDRQSVSNDPVVADQPCQVTQAVLDDRARRYLTRCRAWLAAGKEASALSTSTAFTSAALRLPASAACAACKSPRPSAPTR